MSSGSQLPAKKFAEVDGRRLAYVEVGAGPPIVLLHGNPTSSYLWRDVIPGLVGHGRVIAPDLIGQGDSEKLPASDGPGRYSFEVAYRYLDGLVSALGADRAVTLVGHDWGSALGFHWARLHQEQVRAVAYMEGIVTPLVSWDELAREGAGDLPGLPVAKGRGPDPQTQPVRRSRVARLHPSKAIRRRDGPLPRPIRRRGRSASHLELAAPDPHRRRTCGHGGAGRPVRGLAQPIASPEAVCQRRSGVDSGRRATGVLPDMA